MKRGLVNLLTALSLVLCVAVTVLWERSYRWMDQVRRWFPPGAILLAHSDHGRVYLAAAWGLDHSNRGWERESRDVAGQPGVWERDAGAANYSVSLLGFGYVNFDRVEGIADRLRLVTVPHWFLSVSLAALPGVRLVRAMRRRRHARAGLCPACGYDLRATSGRCPECGTPVSGSPTA